MSNQSEITKLSIFLQNCEIGKTSSEQYAEKFFNNHVDSVSYLQMMTSSELNEMCTKIGLIGVHRRLLDRGLNQHDEIENQNKRKQALAEVDQIRELAQQFKTAQITESTARKQEVQSQLEAAVARVLPATDWRMNLQNENQCLAQLEKRLTSWSKGTSVGSYPNNYTLANNISGKNLCKALMFLPGLSETEFASYANSPLLDHRKHEDVKSEGDLRLQSDIMTSHVEKSFTKQSCFSSYANDLRKGCVNYSMSVEAGAFFGWGAAAVSASSSGASESRSESRVNRKGATTNAVHTLTQFVHVSSVALDPNRINLADEVSVHLNGIHLENSVEAMAFMRQYGSHFVGTNQVIGGTHIRISEVSFQESLDETTALGILSEVARSSGAVSGWGVSSGFAGKVNVGGHRATSSDSATARGSNRHSKESSRSYRDEFVGPDVDDLPLMRQLLETNTKTQHVINNGLNLACGNADVCQQVFPIWALFLRRTPFSIGDKNSVDIGKCLRDAWLLSVIDSPEFNHREGFFRKMVEFTLANRTCHDNSSWADKYHQRILAKESITHAVGKVSLGSWPNSPVRNNRVNVSFPKPFASPPRIVLGISDYDCDRNFNTRLQVTAENITTHGFQLVADSWATSNTWILGISWIATISANVASGRVQTGGSWPHNPMKSFRQVVNFPTRLLRIPEVWVSLSKVDAESGFNTRVAVHAEDITTSGFTVRAESWDNSLTWTIEIDWLASTDEKLRVGTQTVGSWPHSPIQSNTPQTAAAISFSPSINIDSFTTALAGFDVDCDHNSRIATSLTKNGSTYQTTASTWADSNIWMAKIAYVVKLS